MIEDLGEESPGNNVQHQLILGDDEFVLKHRDGLIDSNMTAVAKAQRRTAALSLAEYRNL
jgi:hypothetical protein